MQELKKEKLVLIDGHSILNRSYYGIPELTNSRGIHTNAVYGFLNTMFKLIDDEKPQYLAVAFDVSHPTFRHEMYDAYKGTRKPMQPELREQVPLIKEILTAMGVKTAMLAGFEADDVIGTLSKKGGEEGLNVLVFSGDRDLLQLVSDTTTVRIPRTVRGTKTETDFDREKVKDDYGVYPEQFADFKALMGDSSDNIPGVPGIGEKTASKLVSEFGSIEKLHERTEEVSNRKAREALTDYYDMAVLSKKLAVIDTNVAGLPDPRECALGDIYTSDALRMIKDLELKSLYSRFDGKDKAAGISECFHFVSESAQAAEIIERAKEAPLCALAVTAEKSAPTGIKPDDKILGVSLCFDPDHVFCLIPGEEAGDDGRGQVTEAFLSEALLDLSKNAKRLAVLDIKEKESLLKTRESGNADDLKIVAYLLNPIKNTYDYDDLARDFAGTSVPSVKEILGKKKIADAFAEDERLANFPACYEAYVLFHSHGSMKEALRDSGMKELYEQIELPLVYCLFDMQNAGVRVKGDALKKYGESLEGKIKTLEEQIYSLAGCTFNINSPKQLGEVLFGEQRLALPGGKKTKTGYSTAADVLEKLAPQHPVIEKILMYRQLSKLKSTYADALPGCIGSDGRIHSTFNQTITATGRISSTDPNLQNIPVRMELGREIRRVFVPEEGCVFIDADYSQIELRLLAHMSGDKNLIEAYNTGSDIHRITASKVFHVAPDEVTDEMRRNAKAVNFGIVYGISSYGLGSDLSISRKEAEGYINEYFETYPGIKAFLDENVRFAKENGYVKTLYGRRRPVPELKSSNYAQRSFGERVAMNSPIQGTAADIMKIAMIKTQRALVEEGLSSRIVLQVHDELLIEAPEDEAPAVREILARCMKGAADLLVPLEISLGEGKSWFDAH